MHGRNRKLGHHDMKLIYFLLASLLLPAIMLAQGSGREHDSSKSKTDLTAEVKALREALMQTQKQLAAQQQEIETLKVQSRNAVAASNTSKLVPTRGDGSSGDSVSSGLERAVKHAAADIEQQPPAQQVQEKGKPEAPPVGAFKLDNAVINIGGFVDVENIYRTTNTQGHINTPFAAIPFNNTPQGRVSELRTTAQNSRFSFQVTDKFAGNDVLGYLESNFSGNDAPSVYQTSNPHTSRLRLYFLDLKRGQCEALGGQTWGWLTPNRQGIGPMPVDLFLTYNEAPAGRLGVP